MKKKYVLVIPDGWATRWIGDLRAKVEQWRANWNQSSQPGLYFKENGQSTIVHDSRNGKPIEYDVGEVGRQLLAYLDDKPKDLEDVARKMGHVKGFDPARELAALQAKGLVIEESERYLNLVLRKESPKMTAR